eukprot:Blabericola_migrator_1__4813@NODE_2528_length_2641_cov_89_057887_g1536_i1_p1_GENE_NODE_2528_length_2641_cov_89_057887_g1536_i1NODE_2528_length_2641_cov_89_057887_g1536_i1_p1_ORF_typecomplete_len603_score64_65_NODE_2528_length_2641_cov_89_057887_g1536_i1761884
MKGLRVKSTTIDRWVPCCVVLIQPQTVGNFAGLDCHGPSNEVDPSPQTVSLGASSVPPGGGEGQLSTCKMSRKARALSHQSSTHQGAGMIGASFAEDGGQQKQSFTYAGSMKASHVSPTRASSEKVEHSPPSRQRSFFDKRSYTWNAEIPQRDTVETYTHGQKHLSEPQGKFSGRDLSMAHASHGSQQILEASAQSSPSPDKATAAAHSHDALASVGVGPTDQSIVPGTRTVSAISRKRSAQLPLNDLSQPKSTRINDFDFWQHATRKYSGFAKRLKNLGVHLNLYLQSGALEDIAEHDKTPLSLLLRCFENFTGTWFSKERIATNFFIAYPGQAPWMYYWLCYAFSPVDQSCILDTELKKNYVLPVAKPDDVSEHVWAMITDTAKPQEIQTFYNVIYQLHEAWKVKRRRPPPAKKTALDDTVEERLRLCEMPFWTQRCAPSSDGDSYDYLNRLMCIGECSSKMASDIFCELPITDGVTTPDDEFYQMMMGISAAPGPGTGAFGLDPVTLWRRLGFQLMDVRYRGPNGESILSNLDLDPYAIRQCVERGFLKPELLLSVTSALRVMNRGERLPSQSYFIISTLLITANFFLQWVESYAQKGA